MFSALIALALIGCNGSITDSTTETGIGTDTGDTDTGDTASTGETAQFIVDATRLGVNEPCDLNGSNGITVGTGDEFELTDGISVSFTIGSMGASDDVPTHDAGDLWLWTSRPFSAVFNAATDTVLVTLDNVEETIEITRNADDGMFHIQRPLTFFFDAMSRCPITVYYYDEEAQDNVGAHITGPVGDDQAYDLMASKGYYFINDEATPNVPWFFVTHRLEFEDMSATFVDLDETDDEHYEVTASEMGVNDDGKLYFSITYVAYDDWEPLDTTVGTCTEE